MLPDHTAPWSTLTPEHEPPKGKNFMTMWTLPQEGAAMKIHELRKFKNTSALKQMGTGVGNNEICL